MSEEPDGYQTYLLRLWRVQYEGRSQWRAFIENPHTGERLAFASLDRMCGYLKAMLRHLECRLDTIPELGALAGEPLGLDQEDRFLTGQVREH